MAQQLRGHTRLAANPRYVPNLLEAHKHQELLSQGMSRPLLASLGTCLHRHISTQANTYMYNKNKANLKFTV